MNNTVCLIMPYQKTNEITPPFGLLYVGTALKKAGYQVRIYHSTPDETEEAVREILDIRPLFAGFSVITGLPTIYADMMSKMIKKKSNIPVVWGGVHASMVPEDCLRSEYIDFVVMGEGEETACELANCLKNSQDIARIKGLGYKKDNKIIINQERELIRDLSDYRIDFSLLDMTRYIAEGMGKYDGQDVQLRSLGYITSRGCPHKCGFCYNRKFNKRKWRSFNKDIVLEDIAYLKDKYKINAIHFWDDNFITNPKRAFEILEAINLYVFLEARIDYIDEELAVKLRDNKVVCLVIGIESGCDRLLNLMNKGITVKEIVEGVKLLEKYKITAQYSFILGLPTETKQECNQTVQLMYRLFKIHSGASYTVGMYLPYPGTELYPLAIQEGFQPPSNLSQWGKIDRWRNTVPLPWISQKYCLNVRHIFALLGAARSKWLKLYLEFKLRYNLLNFGLDLKIIIMAKGIFHRLGISK